MTTSECPLMNFETEWTTMSAPRANGDWKYGDRKVLSTTRIMSLCEWAISAMALMSTNLRVGLVGVSTQMRPGCMIREAKERSYVCCP